MFGKIIDKNISKNKILIKFEFGEGIIEAVSDSIINVFSPLKYADHYSKAIEDRNFAGCDIDVKETDGMIVIKTSEVTVNVSENFVIDFYDNDGNMLCEDYRCERDPFIRRNRTGEPSKEEDPDDDSFENARIAVLKKIQGDEKFYGLGDKTGPLNKKGYEYIMWNSDISQPHAENHKSLYKSIPFLIVLREKAAFGIFFDSTYRTKFDMGKENSDYYFIGAEDGNIDYYFIAGPQLTEVISGYTELTGHTPLPQMWALGYHQSRWSYAPESRVKEIVKGFRDNDVPIDAIHLDIDYMDEYKVFTWNKERFHNPREMTDSLNEQGVKVVTIIDPGVKIDEDYSVYKEGSENDYFVKKGDGTTSVYKVWAGDSVFPDFSDKKVRDWWGKNHTVLIDSGVAGIWNDMNEPATFKIPMNDDNYFKNDGRLADYREMHNVYGHLMSKSTFGGLKKYSGKRPFVITRACYAGSQKYSTVWTGDNRSSWDHLRMSIPMLLNLGMSGLAFCGCDIGGFSDDTNPELLTRWIQAGCFSVLCRNHSAVYTRDQEPWCFDEETLNIYRKYVKLRYKLIPYLYDLMWECENNGLPPMRPLMIHYQNDSMVHELNDQFLFGKNMLIAPVVDQGKRVKAVYLPEGIWFDYWTKESVIGGCTIIRSAPLDVCPIYVTGGSIIPNYPPISFVGEKNIEELILDIYPGVGSYTHYQDDKESYGYRNGVYNLFKIDQRFGSGEQDNKNIKITVSVLNDEYSEKYRTFKIIFNSTEVKNVFYNGNPHKFEIEDNALVTIIPAENGTLDLVL